MSTKRLSLRLGLLPSFVCLLASLSASCSFAPGFVTLGCYTFEQIPITPLNPGPQTVFTSPGFIVIHGSGNAKLDPGQSADAIKVEQSVGLPAWADRATVFLNGWRLSYLEGDQHVLALGTVIGKIRTSVDPMTREIKLTWNALGLLRDEDGKEGYSWSYHFTVLGWQSSNLDAAVDHGVVDANDQYCSADKQISDNYFYGQSFAGEVPTTSTALSSFFSFIQNNIFADRKPVAVLPRGFGFSWVPGGWGLLDPPRGDRHLLQVGYNLDHSETFAESKKQYNKKSDPNNTPVPTGASLVGSGFVSWNSYAIFKDNDTRRNYFFGEMISAIGGNDVGVVQPPFSILPSESTESFWSGCGTSASPPVRTEDFVIENVPFQFAIPMLTGWDLEYLCTDQHVKEIGIWIDQWNYQPPTGGMGGRLQYTLSSVLRDDDNSPDYAHSHKVTILGFRPVSGMILR